jgi:hypothetical protein
MLLIISLEAVLDESVIINNTKPRVRKEVHSRNNYGYIPCTLPLIAVIFVDAL